MRRRTLYLIAVAVLGLLVCGPRVVRFLRGDSRRDSWVRQWRAAYTLSADVESAGASRSADTIAELIVEGAKERARRAARYDASYRGIAFPMGDVPDDRGACTDVLIRSLRAAGIDLQELIHRDMSRDFSAYPRLWGLSAPDPNIDHRRAPNQMCYLRRHWVTLGTDPDGGDWQPGDLVYWRLPAGPLHCGVVGDRRGPSGRLMVVHNLRVCREEDCLGRWPIVAHFRHPQATSAHGPR